MEWMMGGLTPAQFWPALGQIMLLDLVLAGDNAVVIALACRTLPPGKRMVGILLGAAAAVLMRVIFTIGVTTLLKTPWLQVVGSLMLVWVAIKLLADEGHHDDSVQGATGIWNAVKIIVIADLVMSLDNVLAIAAAAKGNWALIIIGLAASIPIVIFGSTFVVWILNRFPILIWGAAGLLGWIAGQLIVSDIALKAHVDALATAYGLSYNNMKTISGIIGIMIVLGLAFAIRSLRSRAKEA